MTEGLRARTVRAPSRYRRCASALRHERLHSRSPARRGESSGSHAPWPRSPWLAFDRAARLRRPELAACAWPHPIQPPLHAVSGWPRAARTSVSTSKGRHRPLGESATVLRQSRASIASQAAEPAAAMCRRSSCYYRDLANLDGIASPRTRRSSSTSVIASLIISRAWSKFSPCVWTSGSAGTWA